MRAAAYIILAAQHNSPLGAAQLRQTRRDERPAARSHPMVTNNGLCCSIGCSPMKTTTGERSTSSSKWSPVWSRPVFSSTWPCIIFGGLYGTEQLFGDWTELRSCTEHCAWDVTEPH
ncbi:hypothetical protein FJT64_027961 [Amphibalanus amphitrite]|uniref:Uncharacterized protein n=1 Tax=Amphibalanus amphitrite TaxID=1232801 RepID=A0A6A4W8F0_AMPAM|nr:hypothetical protein FJT64_027961 [Amphibalanus amphitrite]